MSTFGTPRSARTLSIVVSNCASSVTSHGYPRACSSSCTRAAGLTHGAFYSQFESKEAVVAEAVRLAIDESRQAFERSAKDGKNGKALASIVAVYLARSHRDSPGNGCVVAALGADIARQP